MPSTKIPAASFRSHISAVVQGGAEAFTDKTAMYQHIPTLSPTTTELVLIKGTSNSCVTSNLSRQGTVVAEQPDAGPLLLKGTSIAPAQLS